ncbi:gene transfer agent family protein [Enterovirga aerilata]|uniref:Gene transfer agent family protein n=1 Tax=Enterovirga aerilata TaxID=2730920 RepID=A0A849I5I8_9HYPH|nr:gene transfer agent family protein [Enterovirga sp. DB1703]NNM72648.1 gene transfer agent family protein [Enterovirga sp. DB1703]
MANRRRGEVAATLGGERYTLCLTLGALAELEDAFAVADLAALGARLGSGRLSAEDLAKLLGAGLRGGGHEIADESIRAWPAACLPEVASAVAELLAATFGEGGENPREPQAD